MNNLQAYEQFLITEIDGQDIGAEIALRNNFQNIVWVKEGYGFQLIDDIKLEIQAHTFYFIYKGKLQELLGDSKIQKGYLISFKPDFLPSVNQNFNDNFYSLFYGYIRDVSHMSLTEFSEIKEYQDLMYEIFQEYNRPVDTFGRQNIIRHLLMAFLMKLERKSRELITNRFSSTEIRNKEIYTKFLELVEKHFYKHHDVEFYAYELGLRRRKLTEEVKIFNRKPAKSLIQERVILEAKRLLAFSNSNLKEIAYKLGFDTPTYFSRIFKKYTGLTPLEFQKKLKS